MISISKDDINQVCVNSRLKRINVRQKYIIMIYFIFQSRLIQIRHRPSKPQNTLQNHLYTCFYHQMIIFMRKTPNKFITTFPIHNEFYE